MPPKLHQDFVKDSESRDNEADPYRNVDRWALIAFTDCISKGTHMDCKCWEE
jgi:hypothetical protein